MEFRLIYEGRLKSSQTKRRDVNHIQEIRNQIHPQLKTLWNQIPLNTVSYFLEEDPGKSKTSIIKKVNSIKFAPLINKKLYLLVKLHFLFLRPSPPGHLFEDGGDIDNRIKTLIDGLRIPTHQELEKINPDLISTKKDDVPFHCLLEDDKFVTDFSVTTDRLLRNTENSQNVQIIIRVTPWAIHKTWDADVLL